MEKYFLEALKEAKKALNEGEIPVGAVIVKDNEIIARAHNKTEQLHDPTAHAEILAIREAGKILGESLGYRRLTGCDLYVTLEPCSMCAGALVWSRIENLYIANTDPKSGACGSILDITNNESLNHKVKVIELDDCDIKEESKKILQDFFKEKRMIQKLNKKSEE